MILACRYFMQICCVCFHVERLDSSHNGNLIVQYAIEVEPQDLYVIALLSRN